MPTQINVGDYLFRIQSAPAHVLDILQQTYPTDLDQQNGCAADFEISLRQASTFRRFIKPQITFYCGDHAPFKPLPLSQAYPLLEWGMNWCVAAYDFNRLIIHAAVLVKNNKAIIFPALPGSGKSTLSAYLALSGWQLFSDEMAIIDIHSNLVSPMYRPICLKNESIHLIKRWFPDSFMTPIAKDTQKGDVAHLKALGRQQFNLFNKTPIAAIVFPQYNANQELTIYQLNKSQAFPKLVSNAFNYNILGQTGFETAQHIIEHSQQFEIIYNDLAQVSDFLLEVTAS